MTDCFTAYMVGIAAGIFLASMYWQWVIWPARMDRFREKFLKAYAERHASYLNELDRRESEWIRAPHPSVFEEGGGA